MFRTRTCKARQEVVDLHTALNAVCARTALALGRLEALSEDLLMTGTQIKDLADESIQDIYHRSIGGKRVACRNCDGEFYAEQAERPPFFCNRCHNAGWRHVYPSAAGPATRGRDLL